MASTKFYLFPLQFLLKNLLLFPIAAFWRSSHWLPKVECPVLIMHAADDGKVTNITSSKKLTSSPRLFTWGQAHTSKKPQKSKFLPKQVPPHLSKRLFEETVWFSADLNDFIMIMVITNDGDNHSAQSDNMIMGIFQRWRLKRTSAGCFWIKILALATISVNTRLSSS